MVVLPLVPVTARKRLGSARQASSSSPTTSIPRSSAAAITGASRGTPGLLTTVRVPSSSANPSVSRNDFDAGPPKSCRRLGVSRNRPRARPPRARPAAVPRPTPERARPTTRNGPLGQRRAELPRRRSAHPGICFGSARACRAPVRPGRSGGEVADLARQRLRLVDRDQRVAVGAARPGGRRGRRRPARRPCSFGIIFPSLSQTTRTGRSKERSDSRRRAPGRACPSSRRRRTCAGRGGSRPARSGSSQLAHQLVGDAALAHLAEDERQLAQAPAQQGLAHHRAGRRAACRRARRRGRPGPAGSCRRSRRRPAPASRPARRRRRRSSPGPRTSR